MLFFFLLALCTSSGESNVVYQAVGKEVLLDSGAPPNSDVEWRFNGNLIISIRGKSGLRRKGSGHVADKAVLYGDKLKVPRLEPRDSGDYSCTWTGKQYTVHVVSVFVEPGSVLVQGSAAELHCNIEGNSNTEVQWLKPPHNQTYNEKSQTIHLKSVTSSEQGQWMCVINDLELSLPLTVVGLQTQDVNVTEGGKVELPCSLPCPVSQRVLGGKWKADHRPKVAFPTLKNTENLHWDGVNSSEVEFNAGTLSTNFKVTLINVKPEFKGKYVCTVEFEGGAKLTAETNLKVLDQNSGGNVVTNPTGPNNKNSTVKDMLTKKVFGLQLWIWIAVGVSSVVLIGLIIVIVLVLRRNRRKKRVRKLRSMHQPLTAKCYCQCNRSEREIELGQQGKPLPTPRKQHNLRTPVQNNGYE